MSGAKGLSTLGLILLDSHVRITKSDQSNLVALLGKNGKLLFLSGCALRLVIPGKPFLSVSDHFLFLREYRTLVPFFLAADLALAIPLGV
jgi:hypothetical protein